jgi:hypothetical protein
MTLKGSVLFRRLRGSDIWAGEGIRRITPRIMLRYWRTSSPQPRRRKFTNRRSKKSKLHPFFFSGCASASPLSLELSAFSACGGACAIALRACGSTICRPSLPSVPVLISAPPRSPRWHDGAKRRRCGGVKAICEGILVTPFLLPMPFAMLTGRERETRSGEGMEATCVLVARRACLVRG